MMTAKEIVEVIKAHDFGHKVEQECSIDEWKDFEGPLGVLVWRIARQRRFRVKPERAAKGERVIRRCVQIARQKAKAEGKGEMEGR
jgi:hypothetical protein